MKHDIAEDLALSWILECVNEFVSKEGGATSNNSNTRQDEDSRSQPPRKELPVAPRQERR
mgnify:FL=1